MTTLHTTIPLQYLPLFARIAIERVQANSKLRTAPQLDELLSAYAKTYGAAYDDSDGDEGERIHYSAHTICARLSDFMP